MYGMSLSSGLVGEIFIVIYVKTLGVKTISLPFKSSMSVTTLKSLIYTKEGIEVNQQALVFAGKPMEDCKSISDYYIHKESTIHLSLRLCGGNIQGLQIDEKYFSPKFNEQFFKEGDKWLGCGNVDGEWPVSYHGTGKHESKSIAENGYNLSRGRNFSFGHGIYSTPSIKCAESYAKSFDHGGSTYLVVFQNRVNPKTLIKIPKSITGNEEFWISPKDIDIRPYGFCIKKKIN